DAASRITTACRRPHSSSNTTTRRTERTISTRCGAISPEISAAICCAITIAAVTLYNVHNMRYLIVAVTLAACACGPSSQASGIPEYGYQIVHTYPHDRTAFTEG